MQDLRPYQQGAIQMVEGAWKSGKRAPVLVMPTGSGKTTVLAHLLRRRSERPALILCPWRELVRQAVERLEEHNLPAGVMMGPRKPKGESIHVATIQTAAHRELGDYGLIVIDEAHRALANQCMAVLKKYPSAKMLGLTATPIRYDGKPLSRAFDELLEPTSVSELIKYRFLVPPKVFAPSERLDLKGVRWDPKRRDYAPGSLGKSMSKPKLLGDAIEHYKRHAFNEPTLVYACNRQHAQHVCETFTKAGIPSEVMDGNTPKGERAEIFERLKRMETWCIVNIGVLTEGVDLPFVKCQVLLRPTASPGLHLQIVGRGMRPAPGKPHCVVLDHADNFRRHGFPQDDRKWNLRKRQVQKKPGRKPPPVKAKTCPKCKALVSAQTNTCPHCGHVWLPGVLPGKLQPLAPGSLRITQRNPW